MNHITLFQKPDWWGSEDVRAWRKYEVVIGLPSSEVKQLKNHSFEIVVEINNQGVNPAFIPFTPPTSPCKSVVKTVVKIPDEYTQ